MVDGGDASYHHQEDGWGEKVVSTQKLLSKETRGARIRIQGAAPNDVLVQVRDCVGHWCERIHSEHGTWPTYEEATSKAQKEFARLGFNLKPTRTLGESGSFMLSNYDMKEPIIGKPVPTGESIVVRTKVSEEDVPASILARSRAGETGILYER